MRYKQHAYVLFGIGSVAGNAVYRRMMEASPDYRVFAFDDSKVDVTKRDQVEGVMEYVRPTCLVNCAGMWDVERCEVAKGEAMAMNTDAPAIMASLCKKYCCRMVHLSTPMVFDGKRKSPYTEKCAAKPANVFGVTKLAGEQAVAETAGDYVILRAGWLFGEPARRGSPYAAPATDLVDWLSSADRGSQVDLPVDHNVSPTYVCDMAEAAMELADADGDVSGVYNVANSGQANLNEVAGTVADLCKVQIGIRNSDRHIPRHLALSTEKYTMTTGKLMREWREALKECLYRMSRYRP